MWKRFSEEDQKTIWDWPGPPEMSHPLCESDAPKWSKEDCTHEEPPAFARADHQEAG